VHKESHILWHIQLTSSFNSTLEVTRQRQITAGPHAVGLGCSWLTCSPGDLAAKDGKGINYAQLMAIYN